jgi:hypothetical protein
MSHKLSWQRQKKQPAPPKPVPHKAAFSDGYAGGCFIFGPRLHFATPFAGCKKCQALGNRCLAQRRVLAETPSVTRRASAEQQVNRKK